jgi:hypothetical protein
MSIVRDYQTLRLRRHEFTPFIVLSDHDFKLLRENHSNAKPGQASLHADLEFPDGSVLPIDLIYSPNE